LYYLFLIGAIVVFVSWRLKDLPGASLDICEKMKTSFAMGIDH
jgi:hypothetical protein